VSGSAVDVDTVLQVEHTLPKHLSIIIKDEVHINIKASSKIIESIYRALKAEVKNQKSFTKVRLNRTKVGLELTIKAQEISNLKAAINSHLNLIQASVKTLEQI
jgi:tRNA threonylcarbamoyladenosine modification (KEOPS) complex  Pcc1 subunit